MRQREESELIELVGGEKPILQTSDEAVGLTPLETRKESDNITKSVIERINQRSVKREKTSIGYNQSSGRDESQSMSLVDESAQCMMTLMDDSRMDANNAGTPAARTQAIENACRCSQQVYNLMKLKLEVLKFKGKD